MSTTVKPHWFWTKRNDWVSSWHGGQLQSNPIGSGSNAMMFEFHPDMGVNYSQTPLVLDQTQWCLSLILTWGSTSQTPLVLDQTQWCLSFILTWGSTTVKPHWFWTKRNVWVSSWHGGQLQSNPIGSGPNTMMFEFHPDMGVNYSQTPLDLDQTQWLSFILTWGSTTVKPHWFWTKRNDWVSSWHGGQLQSNPIGSGPNAMIEFHPDMGVNYSQTPLVLDQTQWCLSFILTWGSTTVKPHWFWTKRNDVWVLSWHGGQLVKPHWFWTKRNDVWVSSWHGGQLQSNPIGSGPNAMFEFHPDMGVNYSQTPLVLDQTQWCLSFILTWRSTTVKPHWFWTKRNVWVSSWHGGQLQSNPIGSGPNAMMFEFHPDMGVNYSQTPFVLDQTQWCLSFILTWGSTKVKPHWIWTKRNDVWVSSWHGGQLQSNPIGSGPNAMFEFHPDMGVNYSQTPLVLDQTQWCLSFILTWGSTKVKPHWFWTKRNDVWVSSWHGGQLQSNPIGSGPNAMMFEFHPDMGVNYSQTPLVLDQTQWCLSFILTWGSTTVKPHWFWTKRNDVWVSSWHGGQLQSNPIGSGPDAMFEFHPDMGVNYSQTPLALDQTQCLSFILTWGCILFFGVGVFWPQWCVFLPAEGC